MIGAQPELSPQVANARQNDLRRKVLEQLMRSQARGSALSRFARQGDRRGGVRGLALGLRQRSFIGGQPNRLLGGVAARLQPRFGQVGREVGLGNMPPVTVGPPQGVPQSLGRGPDGGPIGPPPYAPARLPWEGNLDQGVLDQLFGGTPPGVTQAASGAGALGQQFGPSSPVTVGGLSGGLVPLGGGTWYDPTTGQLLGMGGGGLGVA
jgi:hypothetical protein